MYGHHYIYMYIVSREQLGEVANPARGQLNRKNEYSMSPFAPENLISRNGFDCPTPCQPAGTGSYSRDFSRFPRRLPCIYTVPPYVIGPVPSLSGHAIAYRCRSQPRVRRHRASSSSNGCFLCSYHHMDQFKCASLFPHHPLRVLG